jgi:pimeloyl-ACP methyl ester carboxylesterase
MTRKFFAGAVVLAAAALGGCWFKLNAAGPIPIQSFVAPESSAHAPVVLVLPGAADSLAGLRDTGIVEAVQKGMPRADVILVGATLKYYKDGGFAQRLHDEVIQPQRDRGYDQIYLAGASLGGMGAVLYERMYPGELTGLLLLAPFMGDDIVEEVDKAGGVRSWDPGPEPDAVDGKNYQRELWRTVKDWSEHRAHAQRVWLACGADDRLLPASKMIAKVLPKGHFVQPAGGHLWTIWDPAATTLLQRIGRSPSGGDDDDTD